MRTAKFSIEYNTQWGESLIVIVGRERFPMKWTEGNVWTAEVPVSALEAMPEYYYAVVKDDLIQRVEWENHTVGKLQKLNFLGKEHAQIRDSWIDAPSGCPFPRKHTRRDFDKPGFRGAGVVVPVFSLRSKDDFGIGEFLDLKALADWAAKCGMCIVQLLPVNDTTCTGGWDDSYPYKPVSSFALNPMYINLQRLGVVVDEAFVKEQKKLNAKSSVDYPAVYEAKMNRLLECFGRCGAKDMAKKTFKSFCEANALWLPEYCTFSAARETSLKAKMTPKFFAWLQYHLDLQFTEAVEYARSIGVSFKGDLPIGVSANSSEAQSHPELFNLDSAAGAPPDFFSADGQNWGFPTYNWAAMSKNYYMWWKVRLRMMNRYFDAFRIDHILGFFRIWEIPAEYASGKMGHFNPAIPYTKKDIEAMGLPIKGLFLPDPRNKGCYQPMISPSTEKLTDAQKSTFDWLYSDFFGNRNLHLWWRNAEHKLPELLCASGMLACGEDLGMIPDCLPAVMDHWKILSLEMSNMDKGRPWPYFSVCATSCHDMETLRMRLGDPTPEAVAEIVRQHFTSSSFLAILPIQDYLAIDGDLRNKDYKSERINDPSNPHNHWAYRMHLDLADLLSDKASDLNGKIRGLIASSGRL